MTPIEPDRRPLYNFRVAPEGIWLIVNTVLGSVVVSLLAQFAGASGFADLGDPGTWLSGLAFGAVRTLLGAILAAATGGQFLGRGQAPDGPTSG